ncbi:MAG: hypothetical protein QF886_26165, partial [Planctomycetota bacterium]|nr:hypothetical protein [Planctomycetota bacterium]
MAEDSGLQKRVEQLEAQVKALTDALKKAGIAAPQAGADFPRPARDGEVEVKEKSPSFGGIYDKPFLLQAGRRTFVGGYIDLEFVNTEGEDSTFDQHRLIPFIYGDISERLKFATEIEFEHGGDVPGAGEIKIEFATLDYLFADAINFRGGIILSPLGKLNLVHDSPIQDLSFRPLVDRVIFPTTLSEAGVGFFGDFYPTEGSKLGYEIYLVNGFSGGSSEDPASVLFSTTKGVRSARGNKSEDNNNNKAFVGRMAFSPMLGLELGGSFHVGNWDDEDDNTLAIYGFDVTFQHGPFELLAEYGIADVELSDAIKASNTAGTSDIPEDLTGYYVQANYHFMPSFIEDAVPFIT